MIRSRATVRVRYIPEEEAPVKIRLLVVVALVAGLLSPATPAQAYYAYVAIMLTETPFGALVFGADAHYRTQPPRAAAGYDPMEDCATGAPVRAQRKTADGWTTLAKGRTNDKGKVKFKIKNRSGRYRAVIKAYTTPDGANCYAGRSAVKRYKK